MKKEIIIIVRYSKDALKFLARFIRKLVLAWDPDFTKLTPDEAKRLEKAENSGFVDETNVDWENLGAWLENHTAE